MMSIASDGTDGAALWAHDAVAGHRAAAPSGAVQNAPLLCSCQVNVWWIQYILAERFTALLVVPSDFAWKMCSPDGFIPSISFLCMAHALLRGETG